MAKTGKPVILSNGLTELNELQEAIETLKNYGCHQIALLKCTTAYPAPPDEANLHTISHMKDLFKIPVGLSDHTLAIGLSVAAVALGAKLIEKHIMLEGTETVDSFFSLTALEFKSMVNELRRAESSLGKVNYYVTDSAKENLQGKRSLYVSSNVKAGEKFTDKNIKSVRPGYGLSPKYKEFVLTKSAKYDLELGDRLSFDVLAD